MPATRVVVDGSNIATEGRSAPSLRQLDDAVRQFQDEFPDSETVVVVDATFGHRIEASERKAFEEAVSHGELVSPPAGAIGRGDAFVLRIAERVGGQVLSNDSFQEFHADHPWLFDDGRLIGGKPVPGVGWIFTPRRPVRGPRSRTGREESDRSGGAAEADAAGAPRQRRRGRSAAVLEAVEAAAAEATLAATSVEPAPESHEGPKARRARRPRQRAARRKASGDPTVAAAIEVAKEEAIGSAAPSADTPATASHKSAATGIPQAVNDPLAFVRFITEHPLGDEVEGIVSNFVSHGAMVDVGEMHCYVPLSGLGSPPPKSARAALKKGEHRQFVVVRLDPPRRGAQLALAELREELALDLPKPRRKQDAAKAAARAGGAAGPKRSKAAKAAKAAKAGKAGKAAKAGKAGKAAKAAKSPSGRESDNSSKTSTPAKAAAKAKASRPSKKANTEGKTSPAGAKGVARGTSGRATGATKASMRQRRDNPHGA